METNVNDLLIIYNFKERYFLRKVKYNHKYTDTPLKIYPNTICQVLFPYKNNYNIFY